MQRCICWERDENQFRLWERFTRGIKSLVAFSFLYQRTLRTQNLFAAIYIDVFSFYEFVVTIRKEGHEGALVFIIFWYFIDIVHSHSVRPILRAKVVVGSSIALPFSRH